MNILHTLQQRFATALTGLVDDVDTWAAMVRPSGDAKFGDFQANCAMPLKAVLNKPPRQIAGEIVERLNVDDLCDPPEIAGPGFINLTLKDDWLTQKLDATAADPRLGVQPVSRPRKIVVDFSSPNVAKPMHVGHLRSTVIGDGLCKILTHLGHDVLSDNHIGDWGTQFGMIIYGYKHFVDQMAYKQDPVAELARLYKLVNTLCDYPAALKKKPLLEEKLQATQTKLAELKEQAAKDKSLKKQVKKLEGEVRDLPGEIASNQQKIESVESSPQLKEYANGHPQIVQLSREETARLHQGDAENRKLWHEFLPLCLAALNEVYDQLDIKFDMTLGESFYDDRLSKVVADLKTIGLAVESDGAQCVFLDEFEAPFIVQKADGAYNYATTDLATIQYRVNELQADEILYVVDHRQSQHFTQLFATARKWGYENVGLQHLKFGTVMGQDGKPFKTRSGDTVGLIGLLNDAITKARGIVAENDDNKPAGPELTESERDEIARVVGLGGIKYADLKHNRESDYVFDDEKMLAMQGDTATYMQYAYARLCGIFRKANVERDQLDTTQPIQLTNAAERGLGLQLLRFEEALTAAATEAKPNLLTTYLFELAGKLSTFYAECPVIKCEDDAVRASRFQLIHLTGRVIQTGLSILGIGTGEKL